MIMDNMVNLELSLCVTMLITIGNYIVLSKISNRYIK